MVLSKKNPQPPLPSAAARVRYFAQLLSSLPPAAVYLPASGSSPSGKCFPSSFFCCCFALPIEWIEWPEPHGTSPCALPGTAERCRPPVIIGTSSGETRRRRPAASSPPILSLSARRQVGLGPSPCQISPHPLFSSSSPPPRARIRPIDVSFGTSY